jgi:hypothetical protein
MTHFLQHWQRTIALCPAYRRAQRAVAWREKKIDVGLLKGLPVRAFD